MDTQNGTVSVSQVLAYLVEDRWLDKRAASRYTSLSIRTLDANKEIRRFRVGGKILFRKSDLDSWIEGQEVKQPAISDLRRLLEKAKGQVMRTDSSEVGVESIEDAPTNNRRVRQGCGEKQGALDA